MNRENNQSALQGQDRAERERADFLFDCVSDALRDHRDPDVTREQALFALQHADSMFNALHRWITSGRPLPGLWAARYVPAPQEDEAE
ncbi:hypothetical protein GCM10027294_07200 [Marinactinospora endophytica]